MKKLAGQYYQLAKQLSAGFKKVYVETKDCFAIRKLRYRGKILSRREEIAVKKNSESLRRLFLIGILGDVPIIGWGLTIAALNYPRFFLTSHFWSSEQRIQFANEEHSERSQFSSELRRHIAAQSESSPDSGSNIRSSSFLLNGKYSSLDNLSSEHIRLLAGANAIHGNILTRRLAPTFITKRMMKNVAMSIMKDDIRLRAEGLDSLTDEELHEALQKRGFGLVSSLSDNRIENIITSPSHEVTDKIPFAVNPKEHLESWLKMCDAIPVDSIALNEEHSTSGTISSGDHPVVNNDPTAVNLSYLLHSIALPEIRPGYDPQNRQIKF